MLPRRIRREPLLSLRAPFDDLHDMQMQINSLFGDLFGRIGDKDIGTRDMPWEPIVDIVEKEDEFLFSFELPGMKLEDIKVVIEGDYLVVTGDRQWKVDEEKNRAHRVERHYGTFRRELRLPSKVDPDKIKATFRDGVLEVRLPVLEIAKPRVVEVAEA
jgi:HSP20 family protein